MKLRNWCLIGINELNAALAEGRSVRLEEVLKLMARFNKYSFNNCLLIAQQFPNATKVMGFHGWKSIGRSVKKGEKGIGITAPLGIPKERMPSPMKGKSVASVSFTSSISVKPKEMSCRV